MKAATKIITRAMIITWGIGLSVVFGGRGQVSASAAELVWVEGERPARAQVSRHPWWYDQVKKEFFTGGNFLSHFDDNKEGTAEYEVEVPASGKYEFWVHANPVKSKLSYRIDGGEWTEIDTEKHEQGHNVAADGKPDLRFIGWMKVGQVQLERGKRTLAFRFHGPLQNHGYLDCFVLSSEPFRPRGAMQPEQYEAAAKQWAEENKQWFPFEPGPDRFDASAGFDLRGLNEPVAGATGRIVARDGRFVHEKTGAAVRFWAVNGPPDSLRDPAELDRCGRMLAKYGVNLVRIHGGIYDESGQIKPELVEHKAAIVASMKRHGIYSLLSIYFPLWLRPKPDTPWLKGYDGQKHPFAALYFNPDFQEQYRAWWKTLLLTETPGSGRLIDDPALAALEIINEDSYFFWTFDARNLPEPQLVMIEKQFGDWLAKKYGSLEAAQKAFDRKTTPRDAPQYGRMGFRNWWAAFTEKSVRDQDQAAFLLESQRKFYEATVAFLRQLGYKGMITCSNWTTANNQVLGPLEKYSYLPGDFLDRHGYFSCYHRGDNAAWSIRNGHTYFDRSALRFDGEQPGKPRSFVHPVMDVEYNGKPSMISETTFNRPNRYRGEAPLFYAAYGALQGADAIVHFALDGDQWSVKPQFFMQPWTLMAPTQMGQFPAAALIYRQGLVREGDVLVRLRLKLGDLLALKGAPLVQDASFDELRAQDLPKGTTIEAHQVIDPLVHLAGRCAVTIDNEGGPAELADLSKFIDRNRRTVVSSTGELKLDYEKGLMTIDTPGAQGASGSLAAAGAINLGALRIESEMELGHVVAVSLDGRPLARASRILLQVMSEERPDGFRTEPAGGEGKRIIDIGHDPWMVRRYSGKAALRRGDAAKMTVTALDLNGYPVKPAGKADAIALEPTTTYYLITAP